MQFKSYSEQLLQDGFTVIDNIYTDAEADEVITAIDNNNSESDTFRRTEGLFAIRQFLKEFPDLKKTLFNDNLREVVQQLFGDSYFVVKSIYFDKPQMSNWYVAWHQDLTISVKDKAEITGFGPWTKKQGQYAVQPHVEVLENIYTVRIHLDDTDGNNGALKVIPGTHLKKVYRPETLGKDVEQEITCNVPKGGIMIMKPLIMHSSSRTTNKKQRRVIHIEFSSMHLPEALQWAEKDCFQ